MKRFEKLASDFSKKYKQWDYIIISSESYIAGYKQALLDANLVIKNQDGLLTQLHSFVGQEEVEVEFKDGSHQLTHDSITKAYNRPEETIKQSGPPPGFSWQNDVLKAPMGDFRDFIPQSVKYLKIIESTTLSNDFLKEV